MRDLHVEVSAAEAAEARQRLTLRLTLVIGPEEASRGGLAFLVAMEKIDGFRSASIDKIASTYATRPKKATVHPATQER